MKYEIRIEGGFTGIPKEFKGEIELREKAKKSLFHVFGDAVPSENENLRDGLQYHLRLIDGEDEHTARFDETNLPLQIRQFINTISKKK